jgi:hypothetical protein
VSSKVNAVESTKQSGYVKESTAVRLRLTLLLTILLSELVTIAVLLPTDLLIKRRLSSRGAAVLGREIANIRHRMMANDPGLGSVMPLPPAPNLNDRHKSSEKAQHHILVVISSCSSCSARDLDRWQLVQTQKPGLDIAILSQDKPEGITEFLRHRNYTMAFFADTTGTISKQYNAVWTPRAYLLDQGNRLRWKQGAETLEPVRLVEMAIVSTRSLQ